MNADQIGTIIDGINSQRASNTESRARQLIDSILKDREQIAVLNKHMEECRAALQALTHEEVKSTDIFS